MFPSLAGAIHVKSSSASGLTVDELDKPFDKFFEDNDSIYNVLSVCLYEVSLNILYKYLEMAFGSSSAVLSDCSRSSVFGLASECISLLLAFVRACQRRFGPSGICFGIPKSRRDQDFFLASQT
uniref:Uncharacterized protein n=1 Tax=Acrobeloides nanus TaxID=290746 RepID=A0A914DLU1_9BILA